jgi:hypothetical protein
MKKLLFISALLLAFSCQKAELMEKEDGRSTHEEPKDSASVTPKLEAEDWEGTIDVNFGF